MGIICCLAQGCRGLALLCCRDQSELLCRRDKALLCSKHPALCFFFFSLPLSPCFFVLSAVSQMKTLLATTHGWINGRINGRADRSVDKETDLSWSVDPFGTRIVLLLGCTVLTKKKITGRLPFLCAQYYSWDMCWSTTEQFFFFSFWKMLRKCPGA